MVPGAGWSARWRRVPVRNEAHSRLRRLTCWWRRALRTALTDRLPRRGTSTGRGWTQRVRGRPYHSPRLTAAAQRGDTARTTDSLTPPTMSRISILAVASLIVATTACNDPVQQNAAIPTPAADLSVSSERGTHRLYGKPLKLGAGKIRTYIALDHKDRGVPVEIGVAMTEGAMYDLPAAVASSAASDGQHKGHKMLNMFMYILDLPAKNPTPYKFVQFDWNPVGHEPLGIYDLPHSDFHFYTVPLEVRNSILPSDVKFAQKAAAFPAAQFRPQFYLDAATLAGVPAALATVPQMGLHWLDVRSPELQQAAGNPDAWQPFTKTFIWGSWNGKFIFHEPMITRAYLMAKREGAGSAVRDEIIPVPVAQNYLKAGYYPAAYRSTYDTKAREYRNALTKLAWRS